jgi:RNA polymerase sigma factor (sigma-70 family)
MSTQEEQGPTSYDPLLRKSDAEYLDIFQQLRPRLISFLSTLGYRREVAEDIIQDVACKLFVDSPDRNRSIESFEHHRNFEPWIFSVIHNAAKDHLRKLVTRHRVDEALLSTHSRAQGTLSLTDRVGQFGIIRSDMIVDHSQRTPTEIIESREVASVINDCIGELPEPQSRALLALVLDDMTAEEVATEDGDVAATIRWRRTEAVRRLKGMPKLQRLLAYSA